MANPIASHTATRDRATLRFWINALSSPESNIAATFALSVTLSRRNAPAGGA